MYEEVIYKIVRIVISYDILVPKILNNFRWLSIVEKGDLFRTIMVFRT